MCVLACPPLPLSGGAGDHLHRVHSVCNACMNHEITLAAHEDLRETFSKTLRYRVTNLSLRSSPLRLACPQANQATLSKAKENHLSEGLGCGYAKTLEYAGHNQSKA